MHFLLLNCNCNCIGPGEAWLNTMMCSLNAIVSRLNLNTVFIQTPCFRFSRKSQFDYNNISTSRGFHRPIESQCKSGAYFFNVNKPNEQHLLHMYLYACALVLFCFTDWGETWNFQSIVFENVLYAPYGRHSWMAIHVWFSFCNVKQNTIQFEHTKIV